MVCFLSSLLQSIHLNWKKTTEAYLKPLKSNTEKKELTQSFILMGQSYLEWRYSFNTVFVPTRISSFKFPSRTWYVMIRTCCIFVWMNVIYIRLMSNENLLVTCHKLPVIVLNDHCSPLQWYSGIRTITGNLWQIVIYEWEAFHYGQIRCFKY